MTVMAESRAQHCGFPFPLKEDLKHFDGSFYAMVLMLPTHMERNRAMNVAM